MQVNIFKLISSIRPDWTPENTKLIPFTDSLTNQAFGLFDSRTDDTHSGLVIKIFGDQIEFLIDRQNEKEIIQILASHQLAKPLLVEFTNGIIYGFTPGRPCSEQDIRTVEMSALIARKLGQFHSIPLTDEQRMKGPCYIRVLRKFMTFIEQHGTDEDKKRKYMKFDHIYMIRNLNNPMIRIGSNRNRCRRN